MTREETKKMIMMVNATYPNFRVESKELAVNAWHLMLDNCTYTEAVKALRDYVQTSGKGFAPSISELLEIVYKNRVPELTNSELKSLLMTGEYSRLPEALQKAVGSEEAFKAWGDPKSDVYEIRCFEAIRIYRETKAAGESGQQLRLTQAKQIGGQRERQ